MSQNDKDTIPFEARKNLALTRLARGAGFVAAVSVGLALFKIPKEKILLAAALFGGIEAVSAGISACDDNEVRDEMKKDTFGSHHEKLEAAGQGLGVGFAIIAAGVAFVKFTKGKDNEQSN
jgi:hypothetical protein